MTITQDHQRLSASPGEGGLHVAQNHECDTTAGGSTPKNPDQGVGSFLDTLSTAKNHRA